MNSHQGRYAEVGVFWGYSGIAGNPRANFFFLNFLCSDLNVNLNFLFKVQ
jgi:hypothetical protein